MLIKKIKSLGLPGFFFKVPPWIFSIFFIGFEICIFLSMVAHNFVMQESSSYSRLFNLSGDERDYVVMDGLKPGSHPMPIATQQIQPNTLQQNVYYDLMPVSS